MTRDFSDATPSGQPADSPGLVGCPGGAIERTFDWASLIPQIVHPDKVAIIEAMYYIDLPMSALDLHITTGGERALSHTAYHVRVLAESGVIRKVSQRERRGATQKFYVLR
jgi:hypothetical protein